MDAGCFSNVVTYSWALWRRGAGSLHGIGTYLPDTVGQGCSLVKRWQLLPPGHCGAVVQAVLAVSEPTFQALWGRDACTIEQVCGLFKRCQNLRPRHFGAGMQAV